MPLDIWLKSDDIARNNKTSVRSEMGAAVMPSHPLNIKQFPFLCVQNSSSWAVQWCWSSLVLELGLLRWAGTFPCSQPFSAVSVSCPGLVTGAGWAPARMITALSCGACDLEGAGCAHPSLEGILWMCCVSQGEVMAGLAMELQQFGLRTCSLPTLASCCFSSEMKTTWKKAVCKFC